jgi:hypothetical protein
MRVEHRIAATDGGDGRQHGIDPGQRRPGIGQWLVIGKAVDLPSSRGFDRQPFGAARGAAMCHPAAARRWPSWRPT